MALSPLRRPAAPLVRSSARTTPVAPKAPAGVLAYEQVHKTWWMPWRKQVTAHEERARTVTVLKDTAENREAARALAAKDGAQSLVLDRGDDLVVLSGGSLRPAGGSRLETLGGVKAGLNVTIDGVSATVLLADGGLDEVDASAVVVAVVDTGVDKHHPALAGRVLEGFNALDGSNDVRDTAGHGTHVAGIIGASGDGPMQGVAPNVKILPIKALGKTSEPAAAIARGIRYAADHGAHVINMSFFVRKTDKGYAEVMAALDHAHAKGVVLIKSAGNTGKEGLTSPAEHPAVITVGALKQNDARATRDRASFSSFGDRLDVAAPGDKILSLKPGGGYTSMSGTSMAAPHVVGLVALLRAQHPDWTPEQVRAHLARTSDDLGVPGKDKHFGHGAINGLKAVFGP